MAKSVKPIISFSQHALPLEQRVAVSNVFRLRSGNVSKQMCVYNYIHAYIAQLRPLEMFTVVGVTVVGDRLYSAYSAYCGPTDSIISDRTSVVFNCQTGDLGTPSSLIELQSCSIDKQEI